MIDILRREVIYLWYYFSLQLEQIFSYWVLGMVLGSVIAVFAKDHIHGLFRSMHGKRLGVLGIAAASALGIASPLCMYDDRMDHRFIERNTGFENAGADHLLRHLLSAGANPQAKAHAGANLSVGNTRQTLIDALTQCLPFIGFPRTLNALACLG